MNIKSDFGNYFLLALIISIFAYVTISSGAGDALLRGDFNSAITAYSSFDPFGGATSYKKVSHKKKSTQKNVFTSYQKIQLPTNILKYAKISSSWKSIFTTTDKNVIFYFYDSSSNFDSRLKTFVAAKANEKYSVISYDERAYRSMNSDVTYGNKICDSFAECNKMREKASIHSEITGFLDRCAKNICLINNRRNEYILVRSHNLNTVMDIILENLNW